MTIKATYSLDVETVRALERIARIWDVSKSEALRRSIRAAASRTRAEEADSVAALDELQRSLRLGKKDAEAWAHRVRSERRDTTRRASRRTE